MARQTINDYDSEWEFKIVRSDSGAFRKPEVFQKLLQEEAVSGWQMVEKLDDGRVRFKRPRSARMEDGMRSSGIDPYRTRYGSFNAPVFAVILGMVIALGVGLFAANATSESGIQIGGGAWIIISIVGIAVVGIGLLVIVIAKNR